MLTLIYWLNLSSGAQGSNVRSMVAEAWWKCINVLVVHGIFIIILWMVPLEVYFLLLFCSWWIWDPMADECHLLGCLTLGTAWSILLLGSETLSLLGSSVVLTFPYIYTNIENDSTNVRAELFVIINLSWVFSLSDYFVLDRLSYAFGAVTWICMEFLSLWMLGTGLTGCAPL